MPRIGSGFCLLRSVAVPRIFHTPTDLPLRPGTDDPIYLLVFATDGGPVHEGAAAPGHLPRGNWATSDT